MAVGHEHDRAEPAVVTNDALLDLARSTGGAQVANDRTSDKELLEALGRRDAWDVLVVPLRSGERDKGFLEVRDRRSRWGRFRDEDLQLLQTLGGQVATALDNVGLMQTLRHEAYHDPVTGLLNRLGLTVEAEERLRAGRLGGMLLVAARRALRGQQRHRPRARIPVTHRRRSTAVRGCGSRPTGRPDRDGPVRRAVRPPVGGRYRRGGRRVVDRGEQAVPDGRYRGRSGSGSRPGPGPAGGPERG